MLTAVQNIMLKMEEKLWLVMFFALVTVGLSGEEVGAAATSFGKTDLQQTNKTYNGGGGAGGGGGVGWGWGGGGGGGGNQRGRWGWGSGGGGGVYWRWGCRQQPRRPGMKRAFPEGDYKIGEFAQCTVKGRCTGMRLDCPLHCGGACSYDCRHMCMAHCKR